MQTSIHYLSPVPCGVLCIPVFVSSCSNTQGSLSLNALMLYDKMKQKLSIFIFALLTWTNYSHENIIKKIKKYIKICQIFLNTF